MKRKLIGGLLALALAATVAISGCNAKTKGSATVTEGAKEITVWAWDPAYNIVALNEAKRIYEAEHEGVTVNVVEMAKADIEQKLTIVLASGSKEGLPDVVLIEDYNAVKYLNSFPDAFVPYDNVDFNNFATSVDFMTVDGSTYGVPFGLATSALYYRSDLFEQAGYTEDDMQNITWSQLIDIGKKVKEVTGINLMTHDPDDAGFIRIMMQSANTWYTDEEGNADFENNEPLKLALTTYKDIVDAEITKATAGWAEYTGSLNDGSVAAVITGCWLTPSIVAEESQSGKWRIAPTPRLDMEGSVNASSQGGSSWFVLNGDRADIAKDFVAKTFAGSTELYTNILKNNGIQSMYSPAFDSAEYQEPQEFFGGQKTNAILAEWTKEVPGVKFGEYTWEADKIICGSLMEIMNGAEVDATLIKAKEQFNTQVQ